MAASQIGLAAPASRVVVALALAFAAAVEHEDAVAAADEHARVGRRPVVAGEHDDCRAVA